MRQASRDLRWAFIEIVLQVIGNDPGLRVSYDRSRRRKGPIAARVVAARRMAVIVYRVLEQRRLYKQQPPNTNFRNALECS